MIPNRIKIPKIEFYITNVCNLTCEDCNRFNNHNFKGWQAWSDYEHLYQQWGKYLDFDNIVLLGGEPLLNPTVVDWVRGINKIWNCNVQILTNGTRLNYVRGLYDLIFSTYNWLGVSLHDIAYLPELEEEIFKFMKPPVLKFEKGHPANKANADFCYLDDNNKRIPVWIQDEFIESAIRLLPNGKFGLHSNNPVDAHAICPIAQNKSYHFIHGKLYKCGPVALFPEFDEQHEFDISAEDRVLMNSYRPLTVEEFNTRGQEFLNTINDPIPQCKFCPAQTNLRKIISIRKRLDKQ